jgi:hypothetical protein
LTKIPNSEVEGIFFTIAQNESHFASPWSPVAVAQKVNYGKLGRTYVFALINQGGHTGLPLRQDLGNSPA